MSSIRDRVGAITAHLLSDYLVLHEQYCTLTPESPFRFMIPGNDNLASPCSSHCSAVFISARGHTPGCGHGGHSDGRSLPGRKYR